MSKVKELQNFQMLQKWLDWEVTYVTYEANFIEIMNEYFVMVNTYVK